MTAWQWVVAYLAVSGVATLACAVLAWRHYRAGAPERGRR